MNSTLIKRIFVTQLMITVTNNYKSSAKIKHKKPASYMKAILWDKKCLDKVPFYLRSIMDSD